MMKNRAQTGQLTMIELLIVVGIISLLGAMSLGVATNFRQRGRVSRTQSTIQKIEMLLDSIYGGEWERAGITVGGEELQADLLGAYESELDSGEVRNINNEFFVVDAWGQALLIRRGGENQPGLDIWSVGPDNTSGTDDDIVNWTRDWRR